MIRRIFKIKSFFHLCFLFHLLLISLGCDSFTPNPLILSSDSLQAPLEDPNCIQIEKEKLTSQLESPEYITTKTNNFHIKLYFWEKCILPYFAYLNNSMKDGSLKGATEGTFTLKEIKALELTLFQNQSLSDNFLSSLMTIKTSLIGEDPQNLTQEQLENLTKFTLFLQEKTSPFLANIGFLFFEGSSNIFRNGEYYESPLFLESFFFDKLQLSKNNVYNILNELIHYASTYLKGHKNYSLSQLEEFLIQLKIHLIKIGTHLPTEEERQQELEIELPFLFHNKKREWILTSLSILMNFSSTHQSKILSGEDWTIIIKTLSNLLFLFRKFDYYIKNQNWEIHNLGWNKIIREPSQKINPPQSLEQIKKIAIGGDDENQNSLYHTLHSSFNRHPNSSLSDTDVSQFFKLLFHILNIDQIFPAEDTEHRQNIFFQIDHEINFGASWSFFYTAFLSPQEDSETQNDNDKSSTHLTPGFNLSHLNSFKEKITQWFSLQNFIHNLFEDLYKRDEMQNLLTQIKNEHLSQQEKNEAEIKIQENQSKFLNHQVILSKLKEIQEETQVKTQETEIEREKKKTNEQNQTTLETSLTENNALSKRLKTFISSLDTHLELEPESSNQNPPWNFSLARFPDGRLDFNQDFYSSTIPQDQDRTPYSFRDLSLLNALNSLLSLIFEMNPSTFLTSKTEDDRRTNSLQFLTQCDLKAILLSYKDNNGRFIIQNQDDSCHSGQYKEGFFQFIELLKLFLPPSRSKGPHALLKDLYHGLYPFADLLLPGSNGDTELNQKEILQFVWIFLSSSFYSLEWLEKNFCPSQTENPQFFSKNCFWSTLQTKKEVATDFQQKDHLFFHMKKMGNFLNSLDNESFDLLDCYFDENKKLQDCKKRVSPPNPFKFQHFSPEGSISQEKIIHIFNVLTYIELYFYRFDLNRNNLIEVYEIWRSLSVLSKLCLEHCQDDLKILSEMHTKYGKGEEEMTVNYPLSEITFNLLPAETISNIHLLSQQEFEEKFPYMWSSYKNKSATLTAIWLMFNDFPNYESKNRLEMIKLFLSITQHITTKSDDSAELSDSENSSHRGLQDEIGRGVLKGPLKRDFSVDSRP